MRRIAHYKPQLYAGLIYISVLAFMIVLLLTEQHRQAGFQTANNLRIPLFLVRVLVLTYAVGAFLKMQRQAKELHAANETLETRVLERTHDVRSANAELLQSEQRFRAIFANASIGIGQVSLEGRLLQANAALCTMLACSEAELLLTPVANFMERPGRERFEECLRAPADNSSYAELRFKCSDGTVRSGHFRVSVVRAEDGAPLFLILLVEDTTAQEVAEQHIERLAYHDSLTGLPNRASFMMRLKEALDRGKTDPQKIALLFIDCDNFKQINDTLGHEAGDEFLKQRAACMRDSLRPGDFLARFGGDEFTVLLGDVQNEETALHIARRVLKSLGEPTKLMGHEIFAGGSIGIAFNLGDGATAEGMLRDADTAMYQVKTSGKGDCIVFEQAMHDRANEQMRIENGLRGALDKGELCVYYQPIIDLETGRMSGTEALVRWEHPEWGVIPGDIFIPIAEDTGLIVPLGYWILEEACRQTKEWQTQWPLQPPLTVKVHLSGHQLKRSDIVEKVVEIVLKTGLPMQCLRLGITEGIVMNNLEVARQKLNRLKVQGIRVTLDDFGAGHSSIVSLIELSVDTIKIDRSFVSHLGDREEAGATVAAIIALAKAHGLDVTGEGVETQDQVVLLQNYGCSLGQGPFFAKPLSADALTSRMSAANTPFVNTTTPQNKEYIESLLSQVTGQINQQTRRAA